VRGKRTYTKERRKEKGKKKSKRGEEAARGVVVSSRVERLVYTEAVESSNPSLPSERKSPRLGSSGGRATG
jgi:hypothetical protein